MSSTPHHKPSNMQPLMHCNAHHLERVIDGVSRGFSFSAPPESRHPGRSKRFQVFPSFLLCNFRVEKTFNPLHWSVPENSSEKHPPAVSSLFYFKTTNTKPDDGRGLKVGFSTVCCANAAAAEQIGHYTDCNEQQSSHVILSYSIHPIIV